MGRRHRLALQKSLSSQKLDQASHVAHHRRSLRSLPTMVPDSIADMVVVVAEEAGADVVVDHREAFPWAVHHRS